MIRIAAVGDVHYDQYSRNRLRGHFELLETKADLLLLAGDLTQSGEVAEAQALAHDLARVNVPVIAVLGNHDVHLNQQDEIMKVLQEVGVITLEGQSTVLEVRGKTIGIMGLKGFGGGFFGACVSEFGEPEMKEFAHHGREQAEVLRRGLASLETDYKIALLHFSPVEGTLLGERKEIYPFLGSYLLAEAIDSVRIHGVFHGHAHRGVERSMTACGVPVRNVAQMVIRHSYKVYILD